ncbi:uncharacterized protein LOC106866501 [Brachypodium distachyon]|uniref:uncharacterized protein LOC106866501 n=1 Tax=Brachypodium distachyon TaxID=15368 RepID=UPI000D0D18AD|nr:uncharacterized protein LOC106866501 [Brachypodium distachyon]|eukprot:XP_014756247.2 uncharacterized protein LOC106866501 [Brachypodium distachyon]
MAEEIASLECTGTWDIVSPPRVCSITCKWVYKLDVKNAFLNGELREVYMQPPPRYSAPDGMVLSSPLFAEKYIQDLLARIALTDEHIVDTLMELNVHLHASDASSTVKLMFLRSINTEGEVKSKEYIRDKLCEIIEFVGPANVVQVSTDNAVNCRGAGLLVQERYSHIFWTPCVVHTLNLALKSIASARTENDPQYDSCNWIHEIAKEATHIRNFIMNHSMSLSMFNDHSSLKLLAVTETRFASQVVMLKRFQEIREALTLMVVSQKWSDYRNDNVEGARLVKETILNDDWWVRVKYLLEFTEPIYSMISAADTDKPCLHLTYEMWDKMIEKVKSIIFRHEGLQPHEESPFFSLVEEILIYRWTKSNTPLHCLAHSLNPKRSLEYNNGPSRFWDIGGDSYELFVGGADFLQEAEFSLDEPELEALLHDIGALDIEENEAMEE